MEKYKLKNCSLQYNSGCVHNHTNVALPSPSPSPKVSENSPRLTSESLMPQKQIYRTLLPVILTLHELLLLQAAACSFLHLYTITTTRFH